MMFVPYHPYFNRVAVMVMMPEEVTE